MANKLIDLCGKRFGNWTVLFRSSAPGNHPVMWDANVTVALNGMYLEMLCVQAKVRFVGSVIKTSHHFYCVDIQTACTIHGRKCGEDVMETQQTKRTIRERASLIAQSGKILMFLLIGQ